VVYEEPLPDSVSPNERKLGVWRLIPQKIIAEPYSYINSLPSKNIRQALIDALHTWYDVPERSLIIVQGVVSLLHNSALLSVFLRQYPRYHHILTPFHLDLTIFKTAVPYDEANQQRTRSLVLVKR
jgi:hypothetical protein